MKAVFNVIEVIIFMIMYGVVGSIERGRIGDSESTRIMAIGLAVIVVINIIEYFGGMNAEIEC